MLGQVESKITVNMHCLKGRMDAYFVRHRTWLKVNLFYVLTISISLFSLWLDPFGALNKL